MAGTVVVATAGGSGTAGLRSREQAATLDALPAAALGPISAALGVREHGFRIHDLTAVNAGQRLRARFSALGTTITDGRARVGISLAQFGAAGALRAVTQNAPRVEGNRVTIGHGPIREWWANGPLGLEQGFDVLTAPARASAAPLTLSLAVSGDLRARLAGAQVSLGGAGGSLEYRDLTATDARGRALAARFEVTPRRIVIEVDARSAHYPVRIDPLVEQAKLTDGAATSQEAFGISVAVAGSTIAVGADLRGSHGAVLVFTEPSGGWASTTAPTAILTEGSITGLGRSLAIDAHADTIVAGAFPSPQLICLGCTLSGGVFVYSRPASGKWTSSASPAELSPNDAPAGTQLGESVAIDAGGDAIVAGAPSHPVGSNSGQGAAYLFLRPASGAWKTTANQTAELLASGSGAAAGQASDALGQSVGISADGNTVVAGADARTISSHTEQGAAYVFLKPHAGWSAKVTQSAYLTASDGTTGSFLGHAVAIAGDLVVAGAPGAGAGGPGAVYAFRKPPTGWAGSATQNAKLTAAVGFSDDGLGTSVAVAGDGSTVLAGARGTGTPNDAPAALYVFAAPAAGWPAAASNLVEHESYTVPAPDTTPGSVFGSSVAVSGGTTVVGAPGESQRTGAAYVLGFPTPTVLITAPADGASYSQGADIAAAYTCSVTGSTFASCSGPVADGADIDTSALGSHTFTVTATTADGVQTSKSVTYSVVAVTTTSTTTTTSPPPPPPTPLLSHVSQSHPRWRAGRASATFTRRHHKKRPPVGTTFSFTINESATVKLTFTYAAAGRLARGRCVAKTKRNRHARRCTRQAGPLSFSVQPGAHKVSFDGVLTRRSRLTPGAYKVTFTATNSAGVSSNPSSLKFTIVK
jgi:hypothetical protein